jgi:hypothetical protein
MNNDAARKMASLIAAVRQLGWRIEEDRRHYIIYPPKPFAMLTMSRTPSDHRAFLNGRADVNRILRQLGKPEVLK